ncbi:restriction endonuclease subunit S [Dietzia kunjamensis]|uniref:restriction endonuclease subunit S n=1 Tax=Dietzia kunjamensis TaxID=322509 RepID=UPI00388D4E87
MADYSRTRVVAADLDGTSFVGVDNLVGDRGGRVDATYLPNTSRLTGYEPGDILMGNIRPYLKKVWRATSSGGCSGDVLAIRIREGSNRVLLAEFLYYLLSSDAFFAYSMRYAKGAKMPRGNKAAIMKYGIPMPPLEVQREIVRVLDDYTQLEFELRSELESETEARCRQLDHFRGELLSFDSSIEWTNLSDVAEYANGKAHEKLADPEGDIPIVTARFISRNGEANRFVRLGDIRTPASEGDTALVLSDLPNGRALARTFYIDRDNAYAINQRVARIRVKDRGRVHPRFLYYFLDRNPNLLSHDNGMDQTHLSKSQVTGLRFPVPSIAEQQRIVESLDALETAVSSLILELSAELAARRDQYEYYRDKLLTFEEAAS